jgi:hypothetical protein
MRWLLPIPGLTNFYQREEDLELRHAFRLPPSIHDRFETAEGAALKQQSELVMATTLDLTSGRAALRQQIEALFSRRGFRWLTRFEIHCCNWDCP